MTAKLRVAAWLALVGFFSLFRLFPIWAGEPMDKIRLAVDNGIQILNDANLKSKDKKQERIDRLKEIISPFFDFTEMARRSLGSHWRRRTPEEKQEFVTLFRDFLETIYSDKIDLYNGEKVVFSREIVDKDYAEVDSKVTNKKGEKFSVVYKLRRADGTWKVYDVVVENISLINNYRSQFNRVITNSSYEELIKKIKDKTG